jgi:hypothetical protein
MLSKYKFGIQPVNKDFELSQALTIKMLKV